MLAPLLPRGRTEHFRYGALGALSSTWASREDPQSRAGGTSATDGGDLIPIREPPEGFLTDRDVDRVLAVLDDPTQVTEAIEDLAREGFDPEEIVVLSGPEGAARLEAPDHERGLRARLSRFAEFVLGDEPEERERYAQELAAGRFLVAVPAGDDLKAKVAEVLGRHGAHDMEHFGEFHGEPLGSARNEVGT